MRTICLLVILLGALAERAYAEEERTLHSVEKTSALRSPIRFYAKVRWGLDPYRTDYKDVTPKGQTEQLTEIRFRENETFRFILPTSLLNPKSSPHLFKDGSAVFWHDPDGDGDATAIAYRIPNRLRILREALLGAERFFSKVARDAELPWNLYKPDEPISVYVGVFSEEEQDTHAYVVYRTQCMKIRHDLNGRELWTAPVHEYFHFAQKMVCNTDNDAYDAFLEASEPYFYLHFLEDMTCEWATDEPIRLDRLTVGSLQNVDAANRYHARFRKFRPERAFFQRNRYRSGALVKYLAEQLAGGEDVSRALDIYELHRKVYRSGKATRRTVLQALAEMLPETRYRGSTAQDHLLHFLRDFAASCVVQAASPRNRPADRLGFHDEAFRTRRVEFECEETRTPYSARPARAYPKPAVDDAERRRRLREIAGVPKRVESLASRFHRIDLHADSGGRPMGIEPRPVFLYAEAPAHKSEVFALRLTKLDALEAQDISSGSTYVLQEDFSLWDEEAGGPRDFVVAEIPGISHDSQTDRLWIGLVGGLSEADHQLVRWSYIASPRLIPSEAAPIWDSQTVRQAPMSGGTPSGFSNGDEFVLDVLSTDRVHIGGDSQHHIPADHRTIHMELVSRATGRPVALVDQGGVRMQVTALDDRRGQRYRFRGTIALENTVTGPCVARVRLSSLLNLGGSDRQVDETCVFDVRDARPRVKHVRVTQGSRTLYDSKTRERSSARLEGSRYTTTVQVWFSEPMKPEYTFVLAGLEAPYRRITASALAWTPDGCACTGRLVVSKVAVPPGGALVYLSIEGDSAGDLPLDSDPYTPGEQPNQEHFFLVDMAGFYDLRLSTEAKLTATRTWPGRGPPRQTADDYAEFRPLELAMRLVPAPWAHEIRDANWPPGTPGVLLQKYLDELRESVGVLHAKEHELAEYEARSGDPPDVALDGSEPVDPATWAAQIRKELKSLRVQTEELRAFRAKVECLARVMKGLVYYEHDDPRSGPIGARFRGGRWTRLEADPLGTAELRLEAKPWRRKDVRRIAWWRRWIQGSLHPSRLVVWHYEPDDVQVLREVLAESRTPGGHEFGRAFRRCLFQTALAMWQYSRSASERGAWADARAVAEKRLALDMDTGDLRFPPLGKGPLVCLSSDLEYVYRFPISLEGTFESIRTPEAGGERIYTEIEVAETQDELWAPQPTPEDMISRYVARPDASRKAGLWYRTNCYPPSEVEWEDDHPERFLVYAAGSADWIRGGFVRGSREQGRWRQYLTARWEIRLNDRPLPPVQETASTPAPSEGEGGPPPRVAGQDERPGVLTGSVIIPSGLDPGAVVAYLEGVGLPAGNRRTAAFTLKGAFTPRFVALSVGSKLRFLNDDDRVHVVYSRSGAGPFQLPLGAGKRADVVLERTGRIRVRDRLDAKDQIKVLVVPNGCFTHAIRGAYRIAEVPAGTYVLRVVPQSGRLMTSTEEVTIRAGVPLVRHVILRPRP